MTTEQPHDSQDHAQTLGPGRLLRNAREQRGWTREQVATRLHLRLTLITEIESDRYDEQTSHTFIRGYLRAYAKLVGIPEETILAAYDKLGLTPPDNIDMQSFSRRSRQQANDSRLKVVTWLVILVLIALSVAWWWQNTARRSAGDDALAATEMGTAENTETIAPVDAVEPVITAATSDAVAVEAAPVADNVATTEVESAVSDTPVSPEAAPSVAVATAASAAVVTEPTNTESVPAEETSTESAKVPQLKLSFTADCWLDVKDGKGKTLFIGLKKANDELVLEGAEPLKFIIGVPMAVNIEYQGKPLDMSRYNDGRAARFSLPQE